MAANFLVIPQKDSTEGYEQEIDVLNDGLASAGFYPQSNSPSDMDVGIERSPSHDLMFKDRITGPISLTHLLESATGVSETEHKILRQLVHLADSGGPFEGFNSGAFREVTGTVFPTVIIWYDREGVGRKKIVEKLISWNGPFPTQITWKVYHADEELLATAVDTITWNGPFESSRTRTFI